MTTEDPWYQNLRAKWKPDHVRLLLVAESAPDDRGDPTRRRFFYTDRLTQYDSLFRGVVEALYSPGRLSSGPEAKVVWLQRLRDDGVFLIDLVPYPVNAETFTGSRSRARRASVDDCVQRATSLRPDGIIVCHKPSFDLLSGPLEAAGLPLLHSVGLPFPLGNTRAEFVRGVREALPTNFSSSM